MIRFLKDTYAELFNITWLSKEDTIRLTGYVIGVSLSVGILVTFIDYILKEILNYLIIN